MAESTGEEPKSVFNEGISQIQRLSNLWTLCNEQSRRGKLEAWQYTQESIWRELSRDAIAKEQGLERPQDFVKLAKENPWFTQYTRLTQGIMRVKPLKIVQRVHGKRVERIEGSFHQYYQALNEREIFLRTLQDAVGKGSKYKDAGEDDMD
jgi:hypothetical protein